VNTWFAAHGDLGIVKSAAIDLKPKELVARKLKSHGALTMEYTAQDIPPHTKIQDSCNS
jgi:hypothetical protein